MKNQLEDIDAWFKQAVVTPTDKNKEVQLGVHFEEVAEMFESITLDHSAQVVHKTADELKRGRYALCDLGIDRQALLDSLCDQIVTAVGVAHMFELNILDGLTEVNRSNWSKFVDGKPLFDENGKIKKGPGYSKPDLSGLV